MKRFQKLTKFWLPPIVWMAIIFIFSSFPTARVSHINWRDFVVKKTIHLFEYAVLFILFYRGFKNSTSFSKKKIVFLSLLLIVLYAASDEFHQTFTQGREGTPRDVLIDGFGGIIAWWGIWKYLPKAPKKLRNWAKNWQIS